MLKTRNKQKSQNIKNPLSLATFGMWSIALTGKNTILRSYFKQVIKDCFFFQDLRTPKLIHRRKHILLGCQWNTPYRKQAAVFYQSQPAGVILSWLNNIGTLKKIKFTTTFPPQTQNKNKTLEKRILDLWGFILYIFLFSMRALSVTGGFQRHEAVDHI